MKAKLMWLIVLMLSIFALPIVHAEDFVKVNDTFTIDVGIVAGSSFLSVAGATLSIFEPETRNLLVSNAAMTELSTGQYYYNFVPNLTGVYYYTFEFTNGTDIVFQAASTFTSMNDMPAETVSEFETMMEAFILFAVGLLLAILGEYIGNYLFTLISGVWFLGNTVQLAFNGQGFTSPILFGLAGVALIYHGVIKVAEERANHEQKIRRNIVGTTNESREND